MMRTTLTLESDVAELLKRLQDAKHRSMRELVNDALRIGLAQLESPPERPRFETAAVHLKPRTQDVDKVSEVLAMAEGEDYR